MLLQFYRSSVKANIPTAHPSFIASHSVRSPPRTTVILGSMAKRRRSLVTESYTEAVPAHDPLPPPTRRKKERISNSVKPDVVNPNPETNQYVVDGLQALRASPDAEVADEFLSSKPASRGRMETSATTLNLNAATNSKSHSGKGQGTSSEKRTVDLKAPNSTIKEQTFLQDDMDPELGGMEEVDEQELKEALSRPPPVNSSYLPLPWKGRLGYACLCTYLRYSNPPVFSSRTCRIASIIENRHPLKDPSQPPHAIKNRPDKDKPADVARGQAFVEGLGLANARDIVKMLRWNEKYGIKFLRLSSEMFPFASHEIYGYKLASFASEVLEGAGKVAAELGHRLTTHPGQFTQLGSPRKEVIDSAIRDLEYHSEMLSLLNLPPQQNRDAVMILHMGGVFGDKTATLDRFRHNYKRLNQEIKNRLVLENDDVSWSVHDLLPVCEELNIPMVLDYHHHNIIFDVDQLREGTLDIMNLYDRIRATWSRKQITQKMHYSEPTAAAITGRQRRKHSPRVATLPPCDPNMDLMIEAKDKEQAVFELMRTFKLPGFDLFNDITPHVRNDENKAFKQPSKKDRTKMDDADVKEPARPETIPDDKVGMGGPERRVYWPPGMEEWLRPAKRTVKNKNGAKGGSKTKSSIPKDEAGTVEEDVDNQTPTTKRKSAPRISGVKKRTAKSVPTPSTSDGEASEPILDEPDVLARPSKRKVKSARQSSRATKVNYAEDDSSYDE